MRHVVEVMRERELLFDDGEEQIATAVEMLAIPMPIVEATVSFELSDGRIVSRQTGMGELIYLAGLDASEDMLAHNLIDLSKGQHPCPPIDVAKAIEWVEGRTGMSLAQAQRDVIEMAVKSKVLVITGGAAGIEPTIENRKTPCKSSKSRIFEKNETNKETNKMQVFLKNRFMRFFFLRFSIFHPLPSVNVLDSIPIRNRTHVPRGADVFTFARDEPSSESCLRLRLD